MNINAMTYLVMYRVIKDSTDATFQTGDKIWMSRNGDLNFSGTKDNQCILKSQQTDKMLDFEVMKNKDYVEGTND